MFVIWIFLGQYRSMQGYDLDFMESVAETLVRTLTRLTAGKFMSKIKKNWNKNNIQNNGKCQHTYLRTA